MKITENIEFDETKPLLSEQSAEFQQWYNESISPKITDKTIPDALDEFNRPVSFTVQHENFTVTVFWLYIYEDTSNWACRNFKLKIN